MKRINKIGLLFSVTFLLLLTVPKPVSAQSRDFNENDLLVFGVQTINKRTIETTDGKTDESYTLTQMNYNLEITNLDSGDKLLDYTLWDSWSNEQDREDFNFSSDQTEFISLFYPQYTVDDNDIILRGIYGPDQIMFIDPNWNDINDNLATNIEDWETTLWIDSDEETRDMGDFIDITTSFSLMGESDLNNGLDMFTEDTHKWYGEMKFEGEIYYKDYTEQRYREYDTYEKTWEIEFTEGGTLKKYKTMTKGEDVGRFSFESEALVQNNPVSLGAAGGLLPGVTHSFEFPIIILAVVLSVVILRMIGKRKS